MAAPQRRIEQQLTMLFRRSQRVHVMGVQHGVDLERSAYAILCRLDDEGPQRLGAIATAFGLDPSTITRQVQALERAGLAARTADPGDRRASLLDLTSAGRHAAQVTRQHRREALMRLLDDWTDADLTDFARLLERFNAAIDTATRSSDEPPEPQRST
ncbi:MAG: MarR family transcriptional regulator [Actinomycetota bacterium]|nr:MarR family transcriptional regulator [Actinomycetota bacterium]